MDTSEVYIREVKKGSATGFIFSDSSPSGDAAVTGFTMEAKDGTDAVQLSSNNTLSWDTTQAWQTAGNINVSTVMKVRTLGSWDATGRFHYQDNQYFIALRDLNEDKKEVFRMAGNGHFGGHWSSW